MAFQVFLMATKKNEGKNRYYSVSKKLRKEGKSSEEFEILLNNLSLEEVIALKLELATKNISNRMYGIPIWGNLLHIVQDAVFKYALSATRTQAEAMRMVGLKEVNLHELNKKFKPQDYFLCRHLPIGTEKGTGLEAFCCTTHQHPALWDGAFPWGMPERNPDEFDEMFLVIEHELEFLSLGFWIFQAFGKLGLTLPFLGFGTAFNLGLWRWRIKQTAPIADGKPV